MTYEVKKEEKERVSLCVYFDDAVEDDVVVFATASKFQKVGAGTRGMLVIQLYCYSPHRRLQCYLRRCPRLRRRPFSASPHSSFLSPTYFRNTFSFPFIYRWALPRPVNTLRPGLHDLWTICFLKTVIRLITRCVLFIFDILV